MNLWDVLIPAASGAMAAIVAFFAGRKKSNAEADGFIVENAKNVIEFYKEMAKTHEARIKALENHLEQQDKRFKLQEEEISTLKEKYEEIQMKYETERARNKNAVRENEILQEKYDNLNRRMNGSED